jgi:periplasmic divalent cation tolerance protein
MPHAAWPRAAHVRPGQPAHAPAGTAETNEVPNMPATSPQATDAVVCLITAPQSNARAIAGTIVERELAACVNIVPLVQSVYRWEGKVQTDDEALLIVKTTKGAVATLDGLLRKIHPYENFELVALAVVAGSQPYLDWIGSSVGPTHT